MKHYLQSFIKTVPGSLYNSPFYTEYYGKDKKSLYDKNLIEQQERHHALFQKECAERLATIVANEINKMRSTQKK